MSTLNLALCTIFSFLPESSRSTVFAVCKQWRASYKYVNPTTAYIKSVLHGDFLFARGLFELFSDQIVPCTMTCTLACTLGDANHFLYFALQRSDITAVDKQFCVKQAVFTFNQNLLEAIEKAYFANCSEEFRRYVLDFLEDKFHEMRYRNLKNPNLLEFVKCLMLSRRILIISILRFVLSRASNSGYLDDIDQRDSLDNLCTFMAENNLFLWKDEIEFVLMFSQRNQCAFDLFRKQLVPESDRVYKTFQWVASYIDGNQSKMDLLLQFGSDTMKRANVVHNCLDACRYRCASVLVVKYDFPTYRISKILIARCVRFHYCEELVLRWIDFESRQNRYLGFDSLFSYACTSSCDRVVRTLLLNHPQHCKLDGGWFGGDLCSPAVAIALLDHPNLPNLQSWMREFLNIASLGNKLNLPLADAILSHPNFLN